MSGDQKDQPVIFYSEEMTDTKISLLELHGIKLRIKTNKYSYNSETQSWITDFIPENYKRPIKLSYDLIDAKNNKKILSKGEKLNIVIAKKLYEKGLNLLYYYFL